MLRDLILKLKENSYSVSFPTQGKFLDIENLKMMLSNGMYGSLQSARTTDSEFALDLIDAEAYFTVLVGKPLFDDLKVKTFRDLDLIDAIEVRNAFTEQMLPFINGWRETIKDMTNKKEETKG
jgi:hypothetical protein